jgi:hypothetical protein
MLLLRPGGGAVEYELDGCGGGRRELALNVMLLAAEDSVEMGGRVLVDGVEVGSIEPFFADGVDEVVEVCLTLDLPADPELLRIECALSDGGPEAHLRLVSLEVRPARIENRAEVGA